MVGLEAKMTRSLARLAEVLVWLYDDKYRIETGSEKAM
jgi:hypothetical protein